MKTYLHKPVKILQFFLRGEIEKCLTQLQNDLEFPTIIQLQIKLSGTY